MKKRFFAIFVCVVMLTCLTACAKDDKTDVKQENKPGEPTPSATALTEAVPADNEAETDDWKDAYIHYLESIGPDALDMETFALIDLNGDGTPELYNDHGTTATGAEVLTYCNGNLESLFMYSYGLHYIEGENLFRDAGGHMDGYYDEIYSIENGKFVSVASGGYGAEDNSNLQFDENGAPIYKYYWEGTEVSKEEYEEMLNSVYDTSRETDPYSEELMYDYNGIFDVIENYIL